MMPQLGQRCHRIVQTFLALSVLLTIAACLPRSWIQPIGPAIGRPNAVTDATLGRLRIVCAVNAATFLGLALTLQYRLAELRRWSETWLDERRRLKFPKLREHLFLLLVVIVGIIIRAVHLRTPIEYDEAYTFLNYARKSMLECIADYESTNNHQLNSFVMHILYMIGGPKEPVIRLGVFTAGVLLIPAIYAWALTWTNRNAAMLATLLVAIAPALITYSVDARGYMYFILAAITLDLACRKHLAGTPVPEHWTALGMISVVMGLWAMPIMLYTIAGSCGAYVILRWPGLSTRERRGCIRQWALQSGLVILAVFFLYSPSFIFRGFMFTQDIILRPAATSSILLATFANWQAASEWWIAGVIPPAVWTVCIAMGLYEWIVKRRANLMWFGPFIAVAVINGLKSSLPPARIFMFLTPWIAVAAAKGFVTICQYVRCPKLLVQCAFGGTLIVGALFAIGSPVIIDDEMRWKYQDVPALVSALRANIMGQRNQPVRLFSPVTTSYPSRFYLERYPGGFPITVNGPPDAADRLYAITWKGKSVEEMRDQYPPEVEQYLQNHHLKWVPVAIPSVYDHPGNLDLFRKQGDGDSGR